MVWFGLVSYSVRIFLCTFVYSDHCFAYFLHIHKFNFPAFRFLFTRPIPLSTFKFCKDHFSFLVVENCEKLWKIVKKGKNVVLPYPGQMDPIIKAVIVQFFQLFGPQQASQFFMEKFHVEYF